MTAGRRLRRRVVRLGLLGLVVYVFVSRSSSSVRQQSAAPAATKNGAAGRRAAVQSQAVPVTSDLEEWETDDLARLTRDLAFQTPQSHCTLHADGSVELRQGWAEDTGTPFLYDFDSVPSKQEVCQHCVDNGTVSADPSNGLVARCCGVCIFEKRGCEDIYPGEGRSEGTIQHILDSGYRLREFTPCELFARIRGRTLWFVGDSQLRELYFAAECFLREFATSLRRTVPIPKPVAIQKLTTVREPRVEPAMCLDLVQGTRICAIRADFAHDVMNLVLPLLTHNFKAFKDDLMVFNTGLHYPVPGTDGRQVEDNDFVIEMKGFKEWYTQHAAIWPKLVWMDTAVQHFDTPDGAYPGGTGFFTCVPLKAWYEGDPLVRAGGMCNSVVAPLIPQFASAHLRVWNASVPFWNTHLAGDCTHWCNPSVYHLWLYLLNDVLRDSGLGNEVHVPERTAAGIAAEAAAVAAAEAAAAAAGAAAEHLPG